MARQAARHRPSNGYIFDLQIITNMEQYQAHPTAVIDEGCTIGEGTRIWHFTHLMGGCTVGRGCTIGQNVFIAKGVTLGNWVKVQNNVSVYEGVTCDDFVFLGPSCVFTNVINPRSAIERKHAFRPTHIGRGASVGANATVLCGVSIGEYAMIGAGAVVTKDVPPYALVVGNPARQTGWVSEYGCTLNFSATGVAVCPDSDAVYHLREGKVEKAN
jgi:UDP-2-acetamido-3-amino-2,3-dideoxy-glucuronate N-acetyltransferase